MNQTSRAPGAPAPAADDVVITKAVLRAAGHLGVSNRILARVIGVSEATVSRMGAGAYTLTSGEKPFELAVLFVRLFRSLDAIVGGERTVAQAWLRNANAAFGDAPLALIQSVSGLVHVVGYLDARRALV